MKYLNLKLRLVSSIKALLLYWVEATIWGYMEYYLLVYKMEITVFQRLSVGGMNSTFTHSEPCHCEQSHRISVVGEHSGMVLTKRYVLQIVLSLTLLHHLIAPVALGWWIINVDRDIFLLKLSRVARSRLQINPLTQLGNKVCFVSVCVCVLIKCSFMSVRGPDTTACSINKPICACSFAAAPQNTF